MDSLPFLLKQKIGSGEFTEPDPQISVPIGFDKFVKPDFQIRNDQNRAETPSLPNWIFGMLPSAAGLCIGQPGDSQKLF